MDSEAAIIDGFYTNPNIIWENPLL